MLIGRTDAVCIAATGSGKTGAYLIPAGVLVDDTFVIVEPTQQLKDQVTMVAQQLSLQNVHIFLPKMLDSLKQLIEQKIASKQKLHLVLDECDLILESHQHYATKLLQLFQSVSMDQRSIHLFSASATAGVLYTASTFLAHSVTMTLPGGNAPSLNVVHSFSFISNPVHKAFVLNQLLLENKPPVLVFCEHPEEAAKFVKSRMPFGVIGRSLT